ncbi:hypothetical protein M1N42_01025, partial [Thermodesulfovibrionales bacterium]|nr:hypothetical protein [Thermodesulfovibrionales bacterium]
FTENCCYLPAPLDILSLCLLFGHLPRIAYTTTFFLTVGIISLSLTLLYFNSKYQKLKIKIISKVIVQPFIPFLSFRPKREIFWH